MAVQTPVREVIKEGSDVGSGVRSVGGAPVGPSDERIERFPFRASGISSGRLADLSRGVLLPLSREVGEFTFTIEVDVSSADNISKRVVDQQVIEMLRQIGAQLENLEEA